MYITEKLTCQGLAGNLKHWRVNTKLFLKFMILSTALVKKVGLKKLVHLGTTQLTWVKPNFKNIRSIK